jgi:hypothetical protein
VQIRARDERGLSESVQWAVLWPALMLVTLGIIQAGIFLHGRPQPSMRPAAAMALRPTPNIWLQTSPLPLASKTYRCESSEAVRR